MMTVVLSRRMEFFLGGRDLEMVTIRKLVEEERPGHLYDRGLFWGAKASAYREEIARAMEAGFIPVLVELEDDLGLSNAIVIDHHGEASVGARSSLEQIFRLLELPPDRWTRWFALVAANDGGYIPAMRRLGATDDEIGAVRAADRQAQGITAEDEAAAVDALRTAESRSEGRLLVVQLPHTRTAAVTDRLELSGTAPENLLIVSPGEVNFFGRRDIVKRLVERYGGWSGGSDPEHGFWGATPFPPDVAAFVERLIDG